MSIEKIEGLFAKFIAERYYENYRKNLDKNPHFIPLDLKTLDATLGHILIQTPESPEMMELAKASGIEITLPIPELRKKIEAYAKTVTKAKIDTKGGKFYRDGEELSADTLLAKIGNSTNYVNLPALVYKNNDLIGILFPSFGSAGKTLFTDFLNKEITRFIKEEIYENTTTKIGFDVGHLLDPTSALFSSPLGLKIQEILSAVDSVLTGKTLFSNAASESKIESFRDEVEGVFAKLRANSSYGPKVSVNIDKDFQGALLSIKANVVIIQDRHENQRIYADLFESPTGAQILALIKNLHFSNNLPEEIEYRVREAIKSGKPKFTNKSKLNRPASTVKLPTIAASLSSSASSKSSPGKLIQQKPVKPLVSLTSLQNLINSHLQDVISANMGDGSQRSILNYRTGRFASSAKVEKMSESREGMITAFYSYMKNPYQTFEPGFRQGTPKTRDPKLLIAKSIREIAETRVANRMRAVSV